MESLGNFPDAFLAEVAGQPDAVRRSAAGLREQADTLRAVAGAGPITFAGMGGSFDACYPATTFLARHGVPASMAHAGDLLHFRRPALASDGLLVLVSQSGRTAEVVDLAGRLRADPAPPRVLSVTNGLDNPLTSLADLAIDTRAGMESGPSTMTFASALTVLAALAEVAAGHQVAEILDLLDRAAARAAEAIDRLVGQENALGEALTRRVADRPSVVLLGRGHARAASEMGALTLKEAAGVPAEAIEGGEFRHGPLELAGPGLAAFVFAVEPATRDLDSRLAHELAGAGTSVIVVTDAPRGDSPGDTEVVAVDPGLDPLLLPAAAIVPVQLVARRLAIAAGRTPGVLERASKVTTRE
jgi:glucosamine--fructose-6-phosphate aminotransferase (isomerizing)